MPLLTYDQKRLPLKGDIMKHVLGIQRVFEILKHIFIDISRGKEQLLQMTKRRLPLKGDIMKHVLGIQRVFEILKHIFIDISRGKEQLLQMTIRKAATEDEGNYCIDYSTIPDHVACNDGVKWMTELACKLHDEQMQSLQNVVSIVKKSVQEGGKQCD